MIGDRWTTPPPPRRARRLTNLLKRAATRPGRWFFIGTYASPSSASSVASRLKRGHIGPPGPWATACRRDDGGRGLLWVRFEGRHEDNGEAAA